MREAVRRHRLLPSALLAILAGGGFAAWALWPSPHAPRADAAHADDDLEWGTAPSPTSPAREAERDVYAADASGVYFASAREHTLRRLPLEAGDASTRAEEPLLRLDLDEGVAVMATGGGTLCFATARGGPRGRMAVRAGPTPGGPFKTVRADGAAVLAIGCDRDAVFVVTAGDEANELLQKSTVERVPLAGIVGGPSVALAHSDGAVTSLALDDARVYWADSIDEKIVAVAKAGGAPVVLADGRGLPRSIVAYADALFWVEQRGESVWTMPKNGGSPHLVVQDFAGFSHLAAGPEGVFWVNEAAVSGGFHVLRAPLAGGDATAISSAEGGVDALLVVGTNVLWAEDGQLSRPTPAAVAGTAPSR
jgi:hypothetical protein